MQSVGQFRLEWSCVKTCEGLVNSYIERRLWLDRLTGSGTYPLTAVTQRLKLQEDLEGVLRTQPSTLCYEAIVCDAVHHWYWRARIILITIRKNPICYVELDVPVRCYAGWQMRMLSFKSSLTNYTSGGYPRFVDTNRPLCITSEFPWIVMTVEWNLGNFHVRRECFKIQTIQIQNIWWEFADDKERAGICRSSVFVT
jgi:hypothetical protein